MRSRARQGTEPSDPPGIPFGDAPAITATAQAPRAYQQQRDSDKDEAGKNTLRSFRHRCRRALRRPFRQRPGRDKRKAIVLAVIFLLLCVSGMYMRRRSADAMARVAAEKARQEAEQLEREKLAAKAAAAKEERERRAKEEAARKAADEKVRQEAERLKQERLAAETAARQGRERKEKEEADTRAAAEKARLEAERLRQERLAAETAAKKERERKEKEEADTRAAAEKARIEAERMKKERLTAEAKDKREQEETAKEAAAVKIASSQKETTDGKAEMDQNKTAAVEPKIAALSKETKETTGGGTKTEGKEEGRGPAAKGAEEVASKFPPGCRWECYVNRYEDLKRNLKDTEEKALEHWTKLGRKEGRKCGCDDVKGTE